MFVESSMKPEWYELIAQNRYYRDENENKMIKLFSFIINFKNEIKNKHKIEP